MLPEQQQLLVSLLQDAVGTLLPDARPNILLERPKVAAHGDVATNVAMQVVAKTTQRDPRELAKAIVDTLNADARVKEIVDTMEVAGPGFINIRITTIARQAVLTAISVSVQGNTFGHAARNGKKVLVEFVSANPRTVAARLRGGRPCLVQRRTHPGRRYRPKACSSAFGRCHATGNSQRAGAARRFRSTAHVGCHG
jgi:hypothetical protein